MDKGGCLCGAVRYAAEADPTSATVCHCRDCQKFTGSAFAALVRVAKEALTIEVTLKTFSSIGGSGNPILRHFCPECGSSIAEEPGTLPGIIVLTDIPQIPRVLGHDFPSHRGPPQRNSIATPIVRSQIDGLPASQCWNSWLCLHQGAPLPSPSAPFAGHVGAGGARSRAINDRISRNICFGTATSAIWKVT